MNPAPKKTTIHWGSNSPTPESNSSQIAANNPFLPAAEIQASAIPSNDIEAIASLAPKKHSPWKAALRSAAKYFLIGAAIATIIALLIMIPYIPTMSFVFIAVCAVGVGLTASILAGIHAFRTSKSQKTAQTIEDIQPVTGAEPAIVNPFSQTNDATFSKKQGHQAAYFEKSGHTKRWEPNFVYSEISKQEDSDDEVADYSGLSNIK